MFRFPDCGENWHKWPTLWPQQSFSRRPLVCSDNKEVKTCTTASFLQSFIITHLWRHGLYPLCFSIFRSWSTARCCWLLNKTSGVRCRLTVFTFSSSSDCFIPSHTAAAGPALALFPRRPFLCPPSLLLSPQLRLRFKPRCASRCHHILAGALPAVRALKRHSHAHTEETKKDDTNMCARKAINSFHLSNLPLLPRLLLQAATAGFINMS